LNERSSKRIMHRVRTHWNNKARATEALWPIYETAVTRPRIKTSFVYRYPDAPEIAVIKYEAFPFMLKMHRTKDVVTLLEILAACEKFNATRCVEIHKIWHVNVCRRSAFDCTLA